MAYRTHVTKETAMTQEQFKVIQKICDDAPRPIRGNLHVGLDSQNGAIAIISKTRDIPVIDWRIDCAVNYIVSIGDPDSRDFKKIVTECRNFDELQEFLVNAFTNLYKENFTDFYFNFGTAHKHHDVFCRVVVPKGDDARRAAKDKFVSKFGMKGWAFQYTQEEFDKFPSEPWWLGTERVVDFEDLEP